MNLALCAGLLWKKSPTLRPLSKARGRPLRPVCHQSFKETDSLLRAPGQLKTWTVPVWNLAPLVSGWKFLHIDAITRAAYGCAPRSNL